MAIGPVIFRGGRLDGQIHGDDWALTKTAETHEYEDGTAEHYIETDEVEEVDGRSYRVFRAFPKPREG
ncbi:MAG: hypothetical protein AAGA99_26310 [Actinomycetota bacterium]